MALPAPARVPWLQVALFVALALGLGLGSHVLASRGGDLLTIVAVYSPLLAGLFVRKVVAREGFGDAGLSLRGIAPRHWLAAALLPLAWHVPGAILEAAVGACTFDPGVVVKALPRLPLAAVGAAIFLVGEELGWRGYLVPKLRAAGPAVAYTLCGLVWFAWHPDVWFDAHASALEMPVYLVRVVGLSFVFGWLFTASGSVWPCLLLHVGHNLWAPLAFKGFRACSPGTWSGSELAYLPPVLLTVLVLWRLGAFRREPAGAVRPPPASPAPP